MRINPESASFQRVRLRSGKSREFVRHSANVGFRDAISIAGICEEIGNSRNLRSLYSLFPSGSASAPSLVVVCRRLRHSSARIFAFSSIKSLSFLPLLHLHLSSLLLGSNDPAICCAKYRRRDRFIRVKLDRYIKNLSQLIIFLYFFIIYYFHVRLVNIFMMLIFFIIKFYSAIFISV